MITCRLSKCGHARAEAAVGWNRFIPLCREHALAFLKWSPNSPTFRWF